MSAQSATFGPCTFEAKNEKNNLSEITAKKLNCYSGNITVKAMLFKILK